MPGIKYKILNQCNPEFNLLRLTKLQLLYQGGDEIIEHVKLFLPKEASDSEKSYTDRLNCANYRNYFAQVINDYVCSVFTKELVILPAADANDTETPGENIPKADQFYHDFSNDVDMAGTSFHEFCKKILETAACLQRAYICLDFPQNQEPSNLQYEADQSGENRAYLYQIPTSSVIDWEYDSNGEYTFLVIRTENCQRQDLLSVRNQVTLQFKVWKMEGEYAKWENYQIKCKLGKEPKADDIIELVDEGMTTFTKIPVICFELTDNLWLGNLIGNSQINIFRRMSALQFAENRSLFAIPVFKQGAEYPANGDLNEIATDPNRGRRVEQEAKAKGWVVCGDKDDFTFAEPAGTSYELIDQQIKDEIDTIFQITGQIHNTITANQTALSRSGTSKQADQHGKEKVLSAYGCLIKKLAIKIYDRISEAREREIIVWQALGLSDYKVIDKADLLKEATSMNLINIPSKTWKKLHFQKIALELAENIAPETQLIIKQEIDQAVDQLGDDLIYPTPPEPSPKDAGASKNSKASAPQSSAQTISKQPAATSNEQPEPDEMHLRGVSSAGIAETVYQQLSEDYDSQLLDWVRAAHWSGPSEVPLEIIDDSNRDNWQASERTGKIQEMGDKMSEGWNKPIILVNEPNDNKLRLIDGHTRYLAAESIGKKEITAFIASVGMVSGPWDTLHSMQKSGEEGGDRKLQSNQKE